MDEKCLLVYKSPLTGCGVDSSDAPNTLTAFSRSPNWSNGDWSMNTIFGPSNSLISTPACFVISDIVIYCKIKLNQMASHSAHRQNLVLRTIGQRNIICDAVESTIRFKAVSSAAAVWIYSARYRRRILILLNGSSNLQKRNLQYMFEIVVLPPIH